MRQKSILRFLRNLRIFSAEEKDKVVLLSFTSPNGRRCRTRTAIHAPKARVLPLHYILYIVALGWPAAHP